MSLYAVGEQLYQGQPSASAMTIYTATLRTEITRIRVVNTMGNDEWFRLFHPADGGSTFDASTTIQWDTTVGSSGFVDYEINTQGSGFFLKRGDNLGFYSSSDAALTVTVYGITETLVQEIHTHDR